MVPRKLTATLGTVLLFAIGIAAAALADTPPPTTTDSTTSTPTDTTATTTTAISTTTSTATTTTSVETTTATVRTTTTTAAPSPTHGATSTQALPHGASRSNDPFATVRSARPQHKHRRRISKPLRVTPPLGQGSYVFPVVGSSGYGDTYGAFRGDVSGKWHHGDDIFAPLGAPVVAVANGTIFGVGWDRVGGWRIWVEDAAADEFYYAHLSGYASSDFHSNRVRAGDVIGFVGNTGDAFPRAPHLHFEVHPHQLLRLGYDGAVDPTTYLDSWLQLRGVHTPLPVDPRLPKQPLLRAEAHYDFRELLAARHLVGGPPAPIERPEIDVPEGMRAALKPQLLLMHAERAMPRVAAGSSTLTVPLLAGLLSVALFLATILLATRALVSLWR